MQILRASAMGMCCGVRRAIATALALDDPQSVTILGELVHNEEVLEELARRGFAMRPESERQSLPATPRVMITAHGMSEREAGQLKAAGKEIIDTTCPLVRRIHRSALDLEAQGALVLVIGKRGHVEVRGLTGDLSRCEVIERPGEVRAYDAGRIGVICQSTASPAAAEAILEAITRHNPGKEILYLPTICRPTLDRQAAFQSLLGQAEAVVIVGGRHSNNTLELVRLAEACGVASVHVQNESDLRPEWFHGFETVGLAAGTSTPESTIDAVQRRLEEFGAETAQKPMRQIA